MAWALGNKRWTVPFVSLNGTICRVDIYKRGYTGSEVIELSANNPTTPGVAAANPFAYSEGDDEDLLNNVIRYRTGYLRLIEETYGSLDEIYPAVNTDRYVEFYYGTTLDFTGFIQAQSFDRAWVGGPREIELPVISPLGLASGVKFDYANFNPPSWKSFHSILTSAFALFDAGYLGYYYPSFMASASAVKDIYLNSLTVCPFGGRFYKRNSSNLDGIYEPKTAEDALKMICTGFGLVLHDEPTFPVFQRVDFQGQYMKLTFPTASELISQSVTDLTSVAEVASAEGRESTVMPLSKIEVTYDGDEKVPDMTFNRCRGAAGTVSSDIPDREFCTNTPVIDDFTGTYDTGAQTIDSAGQIGAGKKILGAYGGGSLREMILFRPNAANNVKVATYTFFEWNGYAARLQFRFQFGQSIEQMDNPSGTIISVNATVKSENVTLATKTWSGSASSDLAADCEVGFGSRYSASPSPLVVEFYVTYAGTDIMTAISDVKLSYYQTAQNEYLDKNENLKTRVINGSMSDVEGSVACGCSLVATTMNRIRINNSLVSGSDEVKLVESEPQYPHLLTAHDRLQIDVLMPYQTGETIYLNRMEVWGSSVKWRMIARSFDPWNDVYRLTLHHSSIFDY